MSAAARTPEISVPAPDPVSAPAGARVPFVDLRPSNAPVKDRILHRFGELIDRGDFVLGEAVGEFETRFAEYLGRRHVVGVSNGLDALRLALEASPLAPGAGVIVPASTFAATFEAVLQAGGTPIVVDVAESDYNLDVEAARRAPRDAVTHVMPVHLYGQLADMRALVALAHDCALEVIEDACQAHGARRDGRVAGDGGRAAAFSFYPAKNLGAMGDAGALATDDDDLAERARALRTHGETRKYHHEYVGYTARLDTMQAIVLSEKLPFLGEWNEQRRSAAHLYTEALSGIEDLRLPPEPSGSESVWHLYVVRTEDPARLARFLAERGIQTGRHYPDPPHLAPAYRSLGYAPGDFPVAEALSREGLSLPLYPGIPTRYVDLVSVAVRDYFGAG